MELFVKHFSELSAQELFEIYKLRVSVFVVEQKCYYQEVDDADKTAVRRDLSRSCHRPCTRCEAPLRFWQQDRCRSH